MTTNTARARELLQRGELRTLFIEELGWDRHSAKLEITTSDSSFVLHALAEKRGMVAYHCPTTGLGELPEYAERRKIEQQVAKALHEHLIVFTDGTNGTQVWQWVKREPNRPVACREHAFHRSQPGDALLQKLEAITFSLDEEERLRLTDVTRRVRAAFDVERVTKRFYDRFQKEHAAFLKFVGGIEERADREWYASVMLNRLMFVYFIQRKGFLDGDRDYLRNRLKWMEAEHGKDKFYSFYRYFLLRLFHEGLGGTERTPSLAKLLGRVPFLNGGLFDLHELERSDRYGKTIQIPDRAFERLFDFFDQYQWHLDERPLRADNEINPDVLGYIFEKYINQKEMGAYYTKEDITGYISRSTVVPFLLDATRTECRVAFENPGGPTVWDLLKAEPDRYIFPALRHGVDQPLPTEIGGGLNPPTLTRHVGDGPVLTLEVRRDWNKPAPPSHALPTETWRESIARRKRYEDLKARLAAGEVRNINDLITLNLDIHQFVQDVIENCEGPELLRAFWCAIETVTILDPTCGSGAFLFAALNVLEPLYDACLNRMEAFVDDLGRTGEKRGLEKFSDFRAILGRVAAHRSRSNFILKTIILNNLYGVDIMEEAVEICKLRLFLKLAAQVEPDLAKPNVGIEPLPDIDFNIRAGNALVGYATYDQVKNVLTGTLDFDNAIGGISARAADLQREFDLFRKHQVDGTEAAPAVAKQQLREHLGLLDDALNQYLAGEYGVEKADLDAHAKWLESHQPFHWFVEFYGIMSAGGFDVIIGNPPWREYSSVKRSYTVRNYDTEKSGNTYALCAERALQLLASPGFFSFIVQLPLVSSSRMVTLRRCLTQQCSHLHLIPCDDRPGKLFDGLEHCRSCIFVARKRGQPVGTSVFTTRYNRWATEARPALFESLQYTLVSDDSLLRDQFPKLAEPLHVAVARRLFEGQGRALKMSLSPRTTNHLVFYQEATQYWVKATVGLPYYAKGGKVGAPAHGRYLFFNDSSSAHAVCAALNSTLFYTYFIAYGDCFHLSDNLATAFPMTPAAVADSTLLRLGHGLMRDVKANATRKVINTKQGLKISYDEFSVSESKGLLDEIDRVLARHYGFTEEELDFIINYDTKYRMGVDVEGEDE